MRLIAWWRNRKAEREREAAQIDAMRGSDESGTPVPKETYLSATRD